jgi:opacity protein-like surface antigen
MTAPDAAYSEDLAGAIDRWTFDETVKARSVMVNVLYSITPADRADRLRPYVGAGVGRAKVEFGSDDTDWEPAWQLSGGFASPLSARLDLLGEVRWFKAKGGVFLDPDTAYGTGGEFESVDVTLGLAYRF